ncbi:hypothetical protein ACFVYP_10110 [Kitasatospora sp. NPDC058201]|uniref:hypothetical protein n=1 Tax=Streptomycetaceae TaxID=2062 RepID=UPI002E764588|nr:hypothetical protein [Streptomyces sp. BE303]MED7948331.1 hypothetical protein [Streptomyces sp. BE303]
MRRLVTVCGTLAAAGALTLALPTSALAAQGSLAVNGARYKHPSGCYEGIRTPLTVTNQTDEPVSVFDAPGCGGSEIAVVLPGRQGTYPTGRSVYID